MKKNYNFKSAAKPHVVAKKKKKVDSNKVVFWLLIVAFVVWSIGSVLGTIAFFRYKEDTNQVNVVSASADVIDYPFYPESQSDYSLPQEEEFRVPGQVNVGNLVDSYLYSYLAYDVFEDLQYGLDVTFSAVSLDEYGIYHGGLTYYTEFEPGFNAYEIILRPSHMWYNYVDYGDSFNSYYIGFCVSDYARVHILRSETLSYTLVEPHITIDGLAYYDLPMINTTGNVRITIEEEFFDYTGFELLRPYLYGFQIALGSGNYPQIGPMPIAYDLGYTDPIGLLVNWYMADGYEFGWQDGYPNGERNGYAEGLQDGYDQGFTDGESTGYGEGYGVGFNEGYSVGFTDGEDEGYDVGYGEGFTDGEGNGYLVGYTNGWYDGQEDKNDYSFVGLLSAAVDVPVQTFTSLFNFELLGVNLANFFFALLSVMVVLAVVKLLI